MCEAWYYCIVSFACRLISFVEFQAFEALLCLPDSVYVLAFQLFDTNSSGFVTYGELWDCTRPVCYLRWGGYVFSALVCLSAIRIILMNSHQILGWYRSLVKNDGSDFGDELDQIKEFLPAGKYLFCCLFLFFSPVKDFSPAEQPTWNFCLQYPQPPHLWQKVSPLE